MKKSLVIAALTLASASAFASQNFTMRADYENKPKYTDVNNADAAATSLFQAKAALWDINTAVGDAKVSARVDFLGSSSALTFVNWGYISKSVNDWTFSIGKLLSNQGGQEAGRIINANTYFNSLAYSGAGVTTANTANGANSNGAEFAYKMGMHKFGLQVTNMTNYGSNSSSKKNNLSFAWDMEISNDLGLQVEYGQGYADTSTPAVNLGVSHALVGVNYGMGDGWNLQFDYTMNSAMTDATGAKADKLTDMVLEVRKTGETYTPVFKYENGTYNALDNSSTYGNATSGSSITRTAMALALEVTPVPKDAFRYHVAYISTSDKYGAAVDSTGTAGPKNGTVTQTTLAAGVKFTTDMLGK